METESAAGSDGEGEDVEAEEAANDESRQRKEKRPSQFKHKKKTTKNNVVLIHPSL